MHFLYGGNAVPERFKLGMSEWTAIRKMTFKHCQQITTARMQQENARLHGLGD
jgi:hypothetical protein